MSEPIRPSNPYSTPTGDGVDELRAERRAIALERAELEARKAERNGRNGLQPETVVELPETIDAGSLFPPPAGYSVPAAFDPTADLTPDFDPFADPELPQEVATAPEDEKPEPAPWPHAHLVHQGLELDVRIPSQSALMAISMLQQLDGMGELQMEIFNTFLGNHLSPASLGKVIKEFTRPETEMTMQGLVQALVNLRVELT
jgi:hypothetical protein